MSIDATADAPPLTRPRLLPGLPRLWRGRHHLQLGLDPAHAVVLELPDPGIARMLDLLDGTRSLRTVIADAARIGVPEPHARAVVEHLRARGLLVSAGQLLPSEWPHPRRARFTAEATALAWRANGGTPTPAQRLRRRRAARVVVTGSGPLARTVAVALASAGVGHVAPALPAAERADTVAAIQREAPEAATGPLRRGEATFVVQVGHRAPAALVAAGYARWRLPHLPVTVREGTVVVGPLVPPTGMPCLSCVDLHRCDRDRDWPQLAAQLAATPPEELCAHTTLLVAAGLAAGEVLSWVDGATPTSLGTSIEVSAGLPRQRRWPPHPDCPCVRRHRHRVAAGGIPGAEPGRTGWPSPVGGGQ